MIVCQDEIDWDASRIVGSEKDYRQRKTLEGVESLRSRSAGMEVLNNHEELHPWRDLLYKFFEKEPPDGEF